MFASNAGAEWITFRRITHQSPNLARKKENLAAENHSSLFCWSVGYKEAKQARKFVPGTLFNIV